MNEEALKCLLCPKPRCSLQGCPVQTPVPDCMRLYREGKLKEAGKRLFENNPLSAITSIVCDWKAFCYGACVLNAKKDPVRWYEIEQEISGEFILNYHPEKPQRNGQTVAILGGGPAGITAAIKLASAGYHVTVYDREKQVGGVLRYGIPNFRLERKYVNAYERIFYELGIEWISNTVIGKDIQIGEIKEQYDAVLIATGAVKENLLLIPGEEKPNVIHALEFLHHPTEVSLGEKVIVIGGGNVAMDACRTAKRLGKETYVYYRKTFENMPANPLEVQEAQEEGVIFKTFEAPVEVKDHSVIFKDCENVMDENGRVKTAILDGTDHEVPCDTLLVAAGEGIDLSVFGNQYPELNKWNYPVVNEDQMTSFDGVFVAGDFILGAKTVVQAVGSAKKAVVGIRKYLGETL